MQPLPRNWELTKTEGFTLVPLQKSGAERSGLQKGDII
jgi:hypothetical protein